MQSLNSSSRVSIKLILQIKSLSTNYEKTYTNTEARIKIYKLQEILNYSQIDQQGKLITIKSTFTINALQEKTKLQIFIESFIFGYPKFPLLNYIIFFVDCFYLIISHRFLQLIIFGIVNSLLMSNQSQAIQQNFQQSKNVLLMEQQLEPIGFLRIFQFNRQQEDKQQHVEHELQILVSQNKLKKNQILILKIKKVRVSMKMET
ncbi:unnamed protein product [Paramecium sonneborni]|uniref:Transmembrane protein n=1 Tax=Paramecium sonneborni TaxID=65129 RepID=A0A8S1Q4Y8_9CILI|nr:unnamed protein product [Paramecium sonneborni]